jgi:hypothetical protein
MFSKPLALVLLALGCLTAAAGGAYVATRHNSTDAGNVAQITAAEPAPAAAVAPGQPAPAQPVAETEAAVTPKVNPPVTAEREPQAAPAPRPREDRPARTASVPATRSARNAAPAATAPQKRNGTPVNGAAHATEVPPPPPASSMPPAPVAPEPARPFEPQPEPPRAPQFEELILPASSVISLQIESPLSTERNRVEDRVDARVTRDVLAAGRVAIPAGSRILGSVTLVERGGKVKERSRLGVRFHTLILGDGSEVALQTEPVYRDGESPAGDSTKKIGGAAVGGAILGAILGGKKGAAVGAATGAAGGTAAVMTGDRNAATLSRGEVVTPRLSAPATITVEKRD